MLLGTSPLRLSFAGGGTDLKEYYENFEGSVVSTAINNMLSSLINITLAYSSSEHNPDK